MYTLKISHACISELGIGSQPICGKRTRHEEGWQIQCAYPVHRDDDQRIWYHEHKIRDGAINKNCTHLHFLAFISRLLHFYSHLHLQVLLYTHCNIICTGTHPQSDNVVLHSHFLVWKTPRIYIYFAVAMTWSNINFAFTHIYSLDQEGCICLHLHLLGRYRRG